MLYLDAMNTILPKLYFRAEQTFRAWIQKVFSLNPELLHSFCRGSPAIADYSGARLPQQHFGKRAPQHRAPGSAFRLRPARNTHPSTSEGADAAYLTENSVQSTDPYLCRYTTRFLPVQSHLLLPGTIRHFASLDRRRPICCGS